MIFKINNEKRFENNFIYVFILERKNWTFRLYFLGKTLYNDSIYIDVYQFKEKG